MDAAVLLLDLRLNTELRLLEYARCLRSGDCIAPYGGSSKHRDVQGSEVEAEDREPVTDMSTDDCLDGGAASLL
jgi:hypothetical protein